MSKAIVIGRKGMAVRYTKSGMLQRCCEKLTRPQMLLAYMQASSIVIGTLITLWLASVGFDTVSLLIYQKVEVFCMSIPMHILTLHLAHVEGKVS